MALSKFKYTGGSDKGVNSEKSKLLYGHHFPLGKAVEVPDDVAHKLRTKAGREGDEFEEVKVGAEKNEAEIQAEKQIEADQKLLARSKKNEKLTDDELQELKAAKAREDARVAKLQEDAKLGR
jgi:hypothetical protein